MPEISLRYSSIHGPFVIPRYEDRSLGESIKAHITAAGDELELEQPETLDEYVDVLHQFKEHYNNVGYIMTDQLGRIALSLSLLYWLQTEAPRPDGKFGYRGLRLRKDVVGTEELDYGGCFNV